MLLYAFVIFPVVLKIVILLLNTTTVFKSELVERDYLYSSDVIDSCFVEVYNLQKLSYYFYEWPYCLFI